MKIIPEGTSVKKAANMLGVKKGTLYSGMASGKIKWGFVQRPFNFTFEKKIPPEELVRLQEVFSK